MCQIARTDNRLDVDQPTWEATTTSDDTVYLKLVNNCFRKHFALKSKKPDADDEYQQTKIRHKLEKRLLMSNHAKKAGLATNNDQKQLKARHGRAANRINVIDLAMVNIKTVLNAMATQLVSSNHQQGNFAFTFSINCVVEASGTVNVDEGRLEFDAPTYGNTITLHVTSIGERSFEIGR
jgi:hypothetical protein